MSDNPLDRLPAFDRVSIRAVLVHAGEDPSAALAEAGIFDPIAIPVIIGDEHDPSGGILGDGITPNLIGTLESQWNNDDISSHGDQPTLAGPEQGQVLPRKSATFMLPPAFG